MEEKTLRVVAALIRKDQQILITERWPNKHMGLTWEFPGGKVEAGESDEQALKRELREELGVEVRVGTCCFQTTYSYSNRDVFLSIYRCEITEGTPQPIDVKNLEWVSKTELGNRPFPPADLIFVQELMAGHIGQETPTDEQEAPFKAPQVLRRINLN